MVPKTLSPEHPATMEPVFEMSASCFYFSHPDPEFAAWRDRVKGNCGDYELCLIGVPKHMSDCYQRKCKRENSLFHSQTSQDGKLVGKRVADVLWDRINFGDLRWNRIRPGRGRPIEGKLAPEAGVVEVLVEKAKIMKQIRYFPSTEDEKKQIRDSETPYDRKNYAKTLIKTLIPREEYLQGIEDDCDELVELVIKHGSFAQVVLKEGLEVIVASYEDPKNDGNFYKVVFESAKTRFMIYFATS
jgi:hypothetical protein